MKTKLTQKFEDIVSVKNLLKAWGEFLRGKRNKKDVQEYTVHLMDNILSLHTDLANHTYRHGSYESFFVNDPKRRHIHKATVRDRLLHHAVYRILYPFFDKTFITDSFSCRNDKGTHKAINRFKVMFHKVSKNHTNTCWVLKCDIKKFFASIDHKILFDILCEYIPDKDIMWLLGNIVESFETARPHPNLLLKGEGTAKPPPRGEGRVRSGIGLPLGNLTSQLFANVYMNRFDQWVKHILKAKHYIRYADDFVFLSHDKSWLENIIPQIKNFLNTELKLSLHPSKLFLKTIASGMDFLGWVNFSRHRILRRTTKRRMLARIKNNPKPEILQSYLGLLKHGNTFMAEQELLGQYWLWR